MLQLEHAPARMPDDQGEMGRAAVTRNIIRGRRLFSTVTVQEVLDLKYPEQVIGAVENGRLQYAWNLALWPEKGQALYLRVLPECVADLKLGRQTTLTWQEVLRRVLPHDEPTISSLEIQRVLSIGSDHLYALCRRGLMRIVREQRRGPGNSAIIQSDSFTRFLARRRWPFPEEES